MPDTLRNPSTVLVGANFLGGVNNKIHPINIPESQAVELQDIDHSTPGLLETRNGFTQVGGTASTGEKYQGVLETFVPTAFGGISRKLLLPDNTTTGGAFVYYWDGSASIAVLQQTGPADLRLVNFTGGTEITMVQARGIVYFQDGTNTPYKFTLSSGALATVTGMPAGLIMAFWLGRVWVSGLSTEPGSVFYSNADDTDTFDQTIQKVKIAVNTGPRVIAMRPLRSGQLIVFTDRSLWQITPFSDDLYGISAFGLPTSNLFLPTEIDPTVGCAGRETIGLVGPDMIFMDQLGNIRSLQRTIADASSGVKSLPISDPIQGFVDNFNKEQLSKARAITFGNKYYISVPYSSSTTNNKTFVYDVTLGSWAGPYSFGVSNWVISTVEGQYRLYGTLASDVDLKLYRFESGTSDNGTAIPFSMTTKRYDFGDLEREKIGDLLVVDCAAGSGTMTVSAAVDGGSFVSLGTIDLSGGADTLPVSLPVTLGGAGIVRGKFHQESLSRWSDIQYKFSCDTLNNISKLLRFRSQARVMEVKGV